VQAAVKKMCDPDTLDLPVLVNLSGGAPGAVTQDEVADMANRLEREGFVDATPEVAIELVAAEVRREL